VQELRDVFRRTLHVACTAAQTLDQRPPIRVLLTGGGATLPFVRQLASMRCPNFIGVIAEGPTPSRIVTANWHIAYK
jgi:hypothetical protein